MQIVHSGKSRLFSFSDAELVAINNCINEVVNNSNVDEHDCHTRIGITLPELEALLSEVGAAIRSSNA